jgi:simple sugar transport system ATP-binding protein
MSREFLRLNHISKSFAGVQALKDISLTLDQGKSYCLVGENGSGKSTLIKVIAGVHEPDAGEIVIRGKAYKRLHPIESIREGIQVIYQDLSLFPNLTVAENIAVNDQISQKRRWVSWREVKETAAAALQNIKVELDLGARVGDLPVADRQLIAIARALLQNAGMIIMDEPTTALTKREVKILCTIIHNLKKDGISVLFVSHKLDEVLEVADSIMILRNGEKVVDCEAGALDRSRMVEFMTGRSLESKAKAACALPPGARVLLRVENLSCRRHFHDISFELRAGEVLGITGLLGSGRAGLALSLFGMLPADSGSVTIEGEPVRLNRVQDALAKGIAYVPEDRLTEGLFLTKSIGENIVVRIINSLVGKARLVDLKAARARIKEWAVRLRIQTPSTDLPASSLSGGNQQRVVLARWLASNPRVLILNGPTVGIDVGSKAEIHEIIRGLARGGMGILVISDDVPELLEVCHRVLLMRKGRITAGFQRQDLTEAQLATMLVSA